MHIQKESTSKELGSNTYHPRKYALNLFNIEVFQKKNDTVVIRYFKYST